MYKTIIDSKSDSLISKLKEVWTFRQLLFSLARRDLRVRYAQTYIGLSWAVINPAFNLIVLWFVFHKIANVDTGGTPSILFTIAGLSAWTYFATLLSEAGNSIIAAQSMIKKIYFPRLVIPLSKALTGLVDFAIVLIFLFFIMLYYGQVPSGNIIFLPVFIMVAVLSGVSAGILISGLSSRYRDFTFIVPMIVRLGMFITPIAYSANDVPEKWRLLYFLNPMAGVVEGFRWCLFGSTDFENNILYSLGVVAILVILSLWYFHKAEREMADIL